VVEYLKHAARFYFGDVAVTVPADALISRATALVFQA
jgi:hypothetical protein